METPRRRFSGIADSAARQGPHALNRETESSLELPLRGLYRLIEVESLNRLKLPVGIVRVRERPRSVLLAERAAKGPSGFGQTAQRDISLRKVNNEPFPFEVKRLRVADFEELGHRRYEDVEDF